MDLDDIEIIDEDLGLAMSQDDNDVRNGLIANSNELCKVLEDETFTESKSLDHEHLISDDHQHLHHCRHVDVSRNSIDHVESNLTGLEDPCL